MSVSRASDDPSALTHSTVDSVQRWLREHWWVCSLHLLATFTVLTRIPLLSRVPYNWDAVQYVLALQKFDIASHQPHPPGNPLYILLGRGINQLLGQPHAALVVLSVVGSVVVVVGTAILGAQLASRFVGLSAAALIAVNPWFWLYGTVALSYTVEAAAGTGVALAAWRAYQQPTVRSAVWLAAAFSIAGGLRPTVLPLLALLWLFGLWRFTWRARAVAVGVTALGCLAWLVPLLVLTGGPSEYLTLSQRLADRASERTALLKAPWPDWAANFLMVMVGWAVALNMLGAVLVVALIRRLPRLRRIRAQTVLLWMWLLPPMLTFVVIHFGQFGYLLLVLPPAVLLCLRQIAWAWPRYGNGLPGLFNVGVMVMAMLASASAILPAVHDRDAAWQQLEAEIERYPASSTMILASLEQTGYFRLLGQLMPSYRVLAIGEDAQRSHGVLYEAFGGRSSYHLDPSMQACAATRLDGIDHVIFVGSKRSAERVVDRSAWNDLTLADGTLMLRRDLSGEPVVLHVADEEIHLTETRVEPLPAGCQASPTQPLTWDS